MDVGLTDITAKRAALTPEAIAFEDAITGRTLSYRTLDERAARAASAFAALGLGPEDRIAILCRNRIEFFETMFACAKLGAILVPLNWRMPAVELSPVMADSAPKLLLFGAEDSGTARDLARPGLVLVGLDEGAEFSFEALIAGSAPIAPRRWRGADIWSLLYTSGTTGTPKAVIQTLQMALVNYLHVTQAFGVREGDRTLNFLPLFHSAGIQLLTMPTLIAGGTVIVLPGFDVERVMTLLEQRRIDAFFGVPAVYQQLSTHVRFDALDLSGVRSWGCGGAPLADVQAEIYGVKGVRICNGYGMTETGPTAFVAAPEDALRKIGSVGKPQFLIEARVVGVNGDDVGAGETGEIWMRGPGVTPGYWRRPDANALSFTPDGWLKSGDLGYRDEEGAYYVSGRIKDMFISGGENVFPAEVENVLARHPAILEAAVVGVADERWGEVGHAFVALRPDAPSTDPASIIAHCKQLLAGYKAPRFVTFVSDFPRTPTGKIRKHLLVIDRVA